MIDHDDMTLGTDSEGRVVYCRSASLGQAFRRGTYARQIFQVIDDTDRDRRVGHSWIYLADVEIDETVWLKSGALVDARSGYSMFARGGIPGRWPRP